MHAYRRNAVATGVLFIIATVGGMVGLAVMRPALADPVNLATVSANEGPLLAGALLQLIGYLACPAIALALYPVLRRHGEGMALGSVVFRTIEAVFYLVSLLGLLALVTLGRAAVAPGAADPGRYDEAAALVIAVRTIPGFVLAVFAFGVGGLLYSWLLFRSALVPRWLSGWGIAGGVATMAAAALVLVGATVPMSPVHLVLNLPIFGQEMVLAGWLIARGFSPRALAAVGDPIADAIPGQAVSYGPNY